MIENPSSPSAERETIPWTSPRAVVAVIAVLLAAKLAVGWKAGLIGDEAYYTLWSLYPLQAGYYDHPPAVVWFIKAGHMLLGQTAFASRLMAIMATAVCALAVWRTGIALFVDRTVAALGALWFSLSLGATVGLLLITPDAPSILFWVLAIWAAAELNRGGNANWWLAFGLFAGLGLDAKYTGFFLGAGIVLWLLAYRRNRIWLRSWQLYAGGVIALALFWPVLHWNIDHDFASLQFQLGRAAEAAPGFSRMARYFPEFVASQFGIFWPGLFLMVVAGGVLFLRRGRRDDPAVGLLVLTAAPAILYFAWHSFHSRVQGNWTLPLFGQLALLGAWAAVHWAPADGRLRAFWFWLRRWQAPLAFLLVLALFVQVALAPFTIPAKLPTDDMAGWPEVTGEMAAVAAENGATVAFVNDYAFMSLLASYARFGGHDLTMMPLAGLDHFTFMPLSAPDEIDGPALYVSRGPIGVDPKETLPVLGIEARFLSSVVRDGPGGRPAEHVDFYLLRRP
ncbi:MAG: glycosyltransferase family 39 protein [Oricola sp.]